MVQCVKEESQDTLWLCETHRDGYHVGSRQSPFSPQSSQKEINKNLISSSATSIDANGSDTGFPLKSPQLNNVKMALSLEIEYSSLKLFTKNVADPLHPFFALEYVYRILCEVIDNADESGRKHFRMDVVRKIAGQMRRHLNKFKIVCPHWSDKIQRVEFIDILKNQAHLYNHFLRSIVRYCVGKLFFSIK